MNHDLLSQILHKSMEYGLPKCSVLGPLLFLIFIYDLNFAISITFHFADDTYLLNVKQGSKNIC